MSVASLRAACGSTGTLVIDTSVVLSYLDGTDRFSAAAAVVLDELVANGTHRAILSAVTVTETLVRPFAAGAHAVVVAETFLQHFANVAVAAIDYRVAREAAEIRARTGLKTPDALIVATARVTATARVVSTDDRWATAISTVPGLVLVHLGAHLPL